VFDATSEEWQVTGNRFDPDLGAELYITNGDTLEAAYAKGILGFTPEGSEPDPAKVPVGSSGFEFQDDEADVEAEFQRHRLFALDLAYSAEDPANPVSHMGNATKDFYVDKFPLSYGNPQWVEVDAKKSLGDVKIRWRINDGPVKTGNTRRFYQGERFGKERGIFYDRRRGRVTGTRAGDEVEVWFTGARRNSSHFTYEVQRRSTADLLILSAENYTAGVPAQDPDGPHYLTYYTDALDELGVDLEKAPTSRHARVVHEQPYRRMSLQDPSRDFVHLLAVGDVTELPLAAYLTCQRLQPIRAPRKQYATPAAPGELAGRRFPDTRGRSRNYRYPPAGHRRPSVSV